MPYQTCLLPPSQQIQAELQLAGKAFFVPLSAEFGGPPSPFVYLSSLSTCSCMLCRRYAKAWPFLVCMVTIIQSQPSTKFTVSAFHKSHRFGDSLSASDQHSELSELLITACKGNDRDESLLGVTQLGSTSFEESGRYRHPGVLSLGRSCWRLVFRF